MIKFFKKLASRFFSAAEILYLGQVSWVDIITTKEGHVNVVESFGNNEVSWTSCFVFFSQAKNNIRKN